MFWRAPGRPLQPHAHAPARSWGRRGPRYATAQNPKLNIPRKTPKTFSKNALNLPTPRYVVPPNTESRINTGERLFTCMTYAVRIKTSSLCKRFVTISTGEYWTFISLFSIHSFLFKFIEIKSFLALTPRSNKCVFYLRRFR